MFLIFSCSCLRSIHWSQVLSWEWRCSWSSADRRCSNYIWVINNFIAYQGATYIRGFTVICAEEHVWYFNKSNTILFYHKQKIVAFLKNVLSLNRSNSIHSIYRPFQVCHAVSMTVFRRKLPCHNRTWLYFPLSMPSQRKWSSIQPRWHGCEDYAWLPSLIRMDWDS